MKISRDETKSILFLSNMYEVNSTNKLEIFLGHTRVELVSEQAVLGITFDTQMTFGGHAKKLKKLTKRMQTVKVLASTSWSCHSRRCNCQWRYTAAQHSCREIFGFTCTFFLKKSDPTWPVGRAESFDIQLRYEKQL